MSGAPVQVTEQTLAAWPLPEPGSDKESRGRVLVVGGTPGTPGAVALAGEASLRAGGGKLQLATAPAACVALGLAVPESAAFGWGHPALDPGSPEPVRTARDEVLQALQGADTVLVGPGLGDPRAATDLVAEVVSALSPAAHLVIDALGTAFLTERRDGLGRVAPRAVVTVNPTELAHLLDVGQEQVEANLHDAALTAAGRTGATVLAGGPTKHVATPDGESWTVSAGGPGLGVSGSGDVQSGIVAGLLARGCEPAQAAVWGAHLHGCAGDALARLVGPVGFLARELPGQVPGLLARWSGPGTPSSSGQDMD